MALCHEEILAMQCITCGAIGKDGLSSLDPENASLLQDVFIISFQDEEDDYGTPSFICYDCVVEIKQWRNFLAGFQASEENIEQVLIHMESENPQQTAEETPLQNKLPNHQTIPKFLQCELCNCVFYTNAKTELAAHKKAYHGSDIVGTKKDVKCEECVTNYAYPEILAWHNEYCHGSEAIVKVIKVGDNNARQYQCIFCDTIYKRHQEIIQHLSRLHDMRNLPFICSNCDSQFVTNYELKKHQVKCKSEKKKIVNKRMPVEHECEQCGLKFVNQEMLDWHTECCHGDKAIVKIVKVKDRHHQFQCNFCKTRFPNQHLILLHLRADHKFINMPFKCDDCGNQYVQLCGLKDHKAKCTKIPKQTLRQLRLYYSSFTE